MNTISSNQNNIEVYLQRRIQAAKDLEQTKIEQKKRQEQNDFISISQQGLQALGSSTQASLSSSPLDSLVTAGTITQEQADAVSSVFQSRGKAIQASGTYSNNTRPQNPLESLITAGTITQEQADAIKNTLEEARQANKPIKNQANNMQTNVLDNLVSDGIITEEQEGLISIRVV